MTRRTFLRGAGGAALTSWRAAQASAEAAGQQERKLAEQGAPEAARNQDFLSEEFEVTLGRRTIRPRLVSPKPELLARQPLLLLSLCGDRETALTIQPYCLGVQSALSHGHRALSFDLPNHGKRLDKYGEGIQGWRKAWVDGEDRFRQFVEEASAVIGWCIEQGRAEPGRVVVYGISRGGYLALRLLAADARISAAAAVAPVTDWRDVSEFSADKGREDLARLRLARYVEALAGKRIFMAIGNSDDRVSTLSCCRFFLDLQEANAGRLRATSLVEFHCAGMSEAGHTVDDFWRRLGAEFLMRAATGRPRGS
jgi:pimeloyl-ACP methyl ester carboxylesterase